MSEFFKCGTFEDLSFGGSLRRFRLKRKIGLREAARLLGMDCGNYSNLECSKLNPPKSYDIIFLDMDGVIADFDTAFKNLTGECPKRFEKAFGQEKFWEAVYSDSCFFFQNYKVDNEGFGYYMTDYGPDKDLLVKLGFSLFDINNLIENLTQLQAAIQALEAEIENEE